MTSRNLFGKLLVIAVSLLLCTVGTDVYAKKAPPKAPPGPTQLDSAIGLQAPGLSWGQSMKEVLKVFDAIIDKDYLPRWESVQPGVGMKDLEAEIENKKLEIRQSKIEFNDLPTNLDGTAFIGEFTYRNQESMLTVDRKGYQRSLFFIRGKLWKIIDVYPYSPKGIFGKDLLAAVEKLEKRLGSEGRQVDADLSVGRTRSELDWQDSKTHLRAVAWSDTAFAVIYEDRDTLGKLASLRTAKQETSSDIDASTKAVLR
jgi:hypothetical protein